MVSTTSEVFLGLTINCARCHDHKIDPISQRDYYRFTAFFHNILNNVKKGAYEDFAFTLNTQTPLATAEEQANWKNQKQQHEKLCAELKTKIDQLEQKVIASLSKGEQDDANDNATVRKRLIHKNWENVLSKEDQAYGKHSKNRGWRLTKQDRPPYHTRWQSRKTATWHLILLSCLGGMPAHWAIRSFPDFPQS